MHELECPICGRRPLEEFTFGGERRDVPDSITDPEWNNTSVITFDRVAGLKEGDGGPILVQGSIALTQSLLKAGLVDEMRLSVFPVILGSGRRLFPDDAVDKIKLTLVDSTTFSNGVQYQVFRPQH